MPVSSCFDSIIMLADKKIVIVGGTTGLGLSAARAFARRKAKVVLVGRSPESCASAEKQVEGAGIALAGDATNEGTAAKAIDLCREAFGGFDGLYHVAGGSGRRLGDGPLHEMTLEGWNKTLELNLTSIMLSNRAAVKVFMEQGKDKGECKGGSILNMGSVLGYSPSPKFFSTHAYAAAKAAIIGLSKSIASYYASENIRINVIAPALVETPMAQRAAEDDLILKFIKSKQALDGGRIGKPGDLDGMASLLMSDQSAFVTGQVLTVDGGWTVSEGQYDG